MNSEYKDIKTLISNLSKASDSLENGSLSVEDISIMLEEARELHERIAILQFQAGQPKVTQEVEIREEETPVVENGELNFSFDFTSQSSEEERTNQTCLLDAIEEIPETDEVSDLGEKENFETSEDLVEEKTEVPDQVEASIKKEEVTVNEVAQNQQTSSINDKFADRAEQETLADRLGKSPIPSLPEAIGLNQKFLFMNDLFEGENGLYKEAIQALNSFTSFIDADEYVNTLAARHNWDSTSKTTKDFIELVERRYS